MATSIPLGSTNSNPMKDLLVTLPPEDSVSSLTFSPNRSNQQFLAATSWDGSVRCWEVEPSGNTIPKLLQLTPGPLFDVCWMDDGSKFFTAGSDGVARCWDLASNHAIPVASHDSPIKSCHWIQSSYYSCLMTGSWDKSLKFWDIRNPQSIRTICLPDRCYCADVNFPMTVVGTADNSLIVYQLEGGPQEYTRLDNPLRLQTRCVAIFRNKNGIPEGVAVGGVEGKVAIQYVYQTPNSFTFRCHRIETAPGLQDIYVVNGIAFHPIHGTLATVGSDGRYIFWDKDAKTNLMISEFMDQPITACSFSNNGQIFAYAVGYDWSKGHEYNDSTKKTKIFLRPCCEELRPKCLSNYKI